MRKYTWLVGILVMAMLAVTFMAGCGKKQQSVVSTSSSSKSGASTASAPAGAVGTLADLIKKQSGLSSYKMTMDMGGMKVTTAVKMEGGKAVAVKSDMGANGWMLMRMDKKMQYMYNPQMKGVMAQPIDQKALAASQKDPLDQIKALVDAKVSSDTVNGIACLKVVAKEGTFWCEKENGLPIQMDIGGKMMKFSYDQVNAVPDSEFELPAGTKIMKMPAMPGAPK